MIPKFGTRRGGKTMREQLQRLVHQFMMEFGVTEVELDEVAEWAVATGRFQRQPISMVKLCKDQLSEACRAERFTDSQGREVRTMHPVRIKEGPKQMVLWADFRTAKPAHMRLSFQQSRQGILADCRAHKTYVDSYNDNNAFDIKIPTFSYDFELDMKEMDLPTEYPDEKPSEEE